MWGFPQPIFSRLSYAHVFATSLLLQNLVENGILLYQEDVLFNHQGGKVAGSRRGDSLVRTPAETGLCRGDLHANFAIHRIR